MAIINISDNTIENGNVIGTYNENNIYIDNLNWNDLEKQISELEEKIKNPDPLSIAVDELKMAIRNKESYSLGHIIKKYAAQFTATTFTNLASEGLKILVGRFLH